jgi:anti-sigma factor RsiW
MTTPSGGSACQDVVPLLSAYLDDDLSLDRTGEVAAHLRSCADCSRYLSQLAATVAALRDLPEPSLPPSVLARLYRAYLRRLGA